MVTYFVKKSLSCLQIAGGYWNTQYATNGVLAQIFATAFEDASYDAELLYDILEGGSFSLPDTTCLNRDTIDAIYDDSTTIERQLLNITSTKNNNNYSGGSPSVSKAQKILTDTRGFRKRTEVVERLIYTNMTESSYPV